MAPTSKAHRFAAAAARGLDFRRIDEADLPFLQALYASTRREELAPVPWPDEAKAEFLAAQFRAQHAHYQKHYPGADWLVILRAGEPVGRLYVVHWAREHRIVDVAFLPEHRGQGLSHRAPRRPDRGSGRCRQAAEHPRRKGQSGAQLV